jgi:hemolysin activation/secretion protein
VLKQLLFLLIVNWRIPHWLGCNIGLILGLRILEAQAGWAQIPINTISPGENRNNLPPSQAPLAEPQILPKIPSLPELIPAAPTTPDGTNADLPGAIRVRQFKITGSTIFSQAEFDRLTQVYLDWDISIADLFEIRAKITQLYLDRGYVTSGAIIPPQRIGKETGVVEINIIEGRVEEIQIRGNSRLNSDYIRNRIAQYTGTPLNQKRLLSGLQLLKLNPLITNIRGELAAGIQPGSSILTVEIGEAPIWHSQIGIDNHRSPSAGSERRQAQLRNINLFGVGDSASLTYSNTNGSNSVDLNYDIPLNPQNTRLSISYGAAASNVIEQPFNILDIQSRSSYYELSVQHPLVQTPAQELTVGITASHRRSQANLLGNIPFPSPGADLDGKTQLSAIRLVQNYTQRSEREVFAARSQFSIGVDAGGSASAKADATRTLTAGGSTINSQAPDSRFLAWRGQTQYVKLLAPDSTLLVRGDIQVANRGILPFEQFGLGGVDSVRGYRQDAVLADNGVFASTEIRLPIARFAPDSILQITPFVDFGTVWNNSAEKIPQKTLFSTGLGLRYQFSDKLTAKVEWGIPLLSIEGTKRTWQENGVYFSIVYNLF